MNERLAAKVKATNKVHQTAIDLYPQLRAIFEPLVGQKIEKADGSLLAKIEAQMPALPRGPGLLVYKQTSNYSLLWSIRGNESGGEHINSYAEVAVYVGHMQGGVLKKLYDAPVLRTDYTVEEVLAKRATYRAAQKVADEAKSALHPFGEYDN